MDTNTQLHHSTSGGVSFGLKKIKKEILVELLYCMLNIIINQHSNQTI